MAHFLNGDSKFTEVVRHLMFYGMTNVFWLLCCIPVVTIGLSTTAMFACLNAYGQTGDPDAWRRFFPALGRNWKQGLLMGVVTLLGWGLLALSALSVYATEIPAKPLFAGALLLAGWGLLTIVIYFFPLLAQFHNRTEAFVRISCVIGFRHFAATLLIAVYWAGGFLLCWLVPYLLPFWAVGGFAGAAGLINRLYHRIFLRYGAPAWKSTAEKEGKRGKRHA